MKIQRHLELYLIFICFISAVTLYQCLGASNTSVGCWKHDALPLLKFKRTLTNDSDILSSWVGNNCCLWERVVRDKATRNVVSLHLREGFEHNLYHGFYRPSVDSWLDEDAYLAGDKVDSSLAELTHLRHLDLSGNDFEGVRIPEFIGYLKQPRYLNLSDLGFHGIIPHHIGNLSSLKVLYLSSQSLIINNMAWVSGLWSLEHLDLHKIFFSEAQNIVIVFHMIPSFKLERFPM